MKYQSINCCDSMNVLLLVFLWSYNVNGNINDFQIGIQLCDGSAGRNTGAVQYTPFLRDVGGWSPWAGDSNYYDPDGIKIGLFGRVNSAYSSGFTLENIDIRFCIQLTDSANNDNGNSAKEGDPQCTPWASEGGQWSDWAGDSNVYDFDAVRVKLEMKDFDGLIITDIQAGIRVTDDGGNPSHQGTPKYTQWLIGSSQIQSSTWSDWAGDTNFYDPDAIKIYLGVKKSIGNAAKTQMEKADEGMYQVNESNESYVKILAISVVAASCLIIVVGLAIGLWCFSKNSNDHIMLKDNDENESDDDQIERNEEITVTRQKSNVV